MVPTSLAGLPEHIPRPQPAAVQYPPPPTVEDAPDLEEGLREPTPNVDIASIDSKPNAFGVFRRYTQIPQHDPEEGLNIDAFSDIRPHDHEIGGHEPRDPLRPFGLTAASPLSDYFAPFLNASYSGSVTKSAAELDRLVNDVILAEDFNPRDLRGFSAAQELKRMDEHTHGSEAFPVADGWRRGTVKIPLPRTKVQHDSEASAPILEVKNVYYRPFLASIKAAHEDIAARRYHFIPFKLFCRAPQSTPMSGTGAAPGTPPPVERLYQEAYNSDALIKLNDEIQEKARSDREPGDDPEMEYAYIRVMPTAFAAHHLAYIPSLPDIIQQAYEQQYHCPPTAAILRFCKKELVQQIWLLLLDDDFVTAYVHGFKSRIHLMGTKSDMALQRKKVREDTSWLRRMLSRVRGWIFGRGFAPEGKHIEGSAFSRRLAEFGFDIYRTLVPDLMHEFELGVWKSTVTHLIRILTCIGTSTVNELNSRFASVPTFGRDTIRRFGTNVADLKKMAARDFEDMVQCAIPVFEGLLPTAHDRLVRQMLFRLATWHALAKLRLHSDTTLSHLENLTRALGQAMRAFKSKVCPSYDTRELDKEVAARARRRLKKSKDTKKNKGTALPQHSESEDHDGERVQKEFNLNTYKFHRLGDYTNQTGTIEGTSTQTGELEHRRCKHFYVRTNKNATFVSQIAKDQRRERFVNHIHQRAPEAKESARKHSARRLFTRSRAGPLQLGLDEFEPLGPVSPRDYHRISDDPSHHVDITGFVLENKDDPAVNNFARELRCHVVERLHELHNPSPSPTNTPRFVPSSQDLAALRIRHNRMYVHKRMLVNYTSYDMRRQQDSINPSSHNDIMLLAPAGSSHPHLYARVLGIFHVNAYLAGHGTEEPTLLQVLWVRWFNLDENAPWGLDACALPRLEFAPLDDHPFGFISPDQVLRSIHLIPAFAHGRSDVALPGYTLARSDDEQDEDWNFYYVGTFSDRDIFMRFLGGGVGHHQIYSNIPTAHLSTNDGGEEEPESSTLTSSAREEDPDEDMEDYEPDGPAGMGLSSDDEDADVVEQEVEDEAVDFGYTLSDSDSSSDSGSEKDAGEDEPAGRPTLSIVIPPRRDMARPIGGGEDRRGEPGDDAEDLYYGFAPP
ncbi:hypothetical protein OH77DRAFT_1499676 [Trametes cingulata]|nr:hypothetical protein OH77DRAFT_1499676 [Trametes cingulata]